MQIKTTMRHLYTPKRMDKIKNGENIKFWWGFREIRLLIEIESHMETMTIWKFLNKLICSLHDPEIANLSIYLKRMKIYAYTKVSTFVFIVALCVIALTGDSSNVLQNMNN
jgi:hypothetical protein